MTSGRGHIRLVAYALKLGASGGTYDVRPQERTKQLFVAGLATFYTVFLLYAAGPKYMLVSLVLYAPGTILFVMTRRELGRKLFSPGEVVILTVSVVGAVVGVIALAAGWITI